VDYALEAEQRIGIDGEAASALLESDRLYFELGAELEGLRGASLAHMTGLEAVPAGCVVQVTDPAAAGEDPRSWIDAVEQKLHELGCSQRRLYLRERCRALEGVLHERGYRARQEVGYVAAGPVASRRSDVRLSPVLSDSDWDAKRAIHERSGVGPDGYLTPADGWIELERRKCQAGPMRAFLIVAAGSVCGAVCSLEVEGLLRLKNIVIAPSARRQGIAVETVHLLWLQALEAGRRAFGTFAVRGGIGDTVYRAAGLKSAAALMEWARPA
jgi:ribosomal protein S18 acetylase RimI-like enzyme